MICPVRIGVLLGVLFAFGLGSVRAEVPGTMQRPVQEEDLMDSAPSIEVPEIDDSNLQRILRQIVRILDRAVEGSVVNVHRFFRLINELFVAIGEYFGMIDRQIQSSQCHDRGCEEYGTRD